MHDVIQTNTTRATVEFMYIYSPQNIHVHFFFKIRMCAGYIIMYTTGHTSSLHEALYVMYIVCMHK